MSHREFQEHDWLTQMNHLLNQFIQLNHANEMTHNELRQKAQAIRANIWLAVCY